MARGRARADAQSQRWRIPAAEIETAVIAALRSFLEDGSALSATLSLGQLPPSRVADLLKSAAALSRSLTNDHTAQSRTLLQSLLSRIEIGATTLALTVALGRLREAVGLSGSEGPESHAIVVPLHIAKRGVEQELMIGTGLMTPGPRDEPLVKALARAYAWFEDLRLQRVKNASERAARERLPRSYVQAHLPLALLAPTIVTDILEGRQPIDLNLKRLMYQSELSIDWRFQRRQLGFEP